MIALPLKWLLIGVVRLYQAILAPLLGGGCRFEPSCSNYAIEALQQHGPFRGSWLALRRLLRCHPFGPVGADPVPSAEDKKAERHPLVTQPESLTR